MLFSCTETPPFPEQFSLRLENRPTACGYVHISIDVPDSYNYRYIITTRLMNSYVDQCDESIGEYVEHERFQDQNPFTERTDFHFEVECPGIHEVFIIRELLSPIRNTVVAPSKGANHLFVQVDRCAG